jgi:hypothetical protein
MAIQVSSMARLTLLGTLFLGACGSSSPLRSDLKSDVTAQAAGSMMKRLAASLTGNYSSEAQSKTDRSYYDIRLHIQPVWTERKDGPWFYVEQARADYQDQPYRQRVYHLVALGGGAFESQILTFADPKPFIGAWKNPAPFEGKDPSMLVSREGCGVILREVARGRFQGGTAGKACSSDINGATYATSEVSLTVNQIVSWDRGYDAQDRQVWGAVKGGYVFDKLTL